MPCSLQCLLAAHALAVSAGLRLEETSALAPAALSAELRGGGSLAAWDLAVSQVVAQEHPWRGLKPFASSGTRRAQALEDLGLALREDERAALAYSGLRWIFGSHHKAGTELLRKLAHGQANVTGMECCDSHGLFGWDPPHCNDTREEQARVWLLVDLQAGPLQTLRAAGVRFRAVHILRDPIAMVVSGYIYHRRVDDAPDFLLSARRLPMAQGLELEARYVLQETGRMMLEAYRTAPRPETLHVRFEAFAESSASFDAAVEAVYNFTLGDVLSRASVARLVSWASRHDLRRHPREARRSHHSADPHMKKLVMAALDAIPGETLQKLKEMRKALGYE